MENQKCENCVKFHYTSANSGWCSFLRMEIRGKSIFAEKCEKFKNNKSNLKNYNYEKHVWSHRLKRHSHGCK